MDKMPTCFDQKQIAAQYKIMWDLLEMFVVLWFIVLQTDSKFTNNLEM